MCGPLLGTWQEPLTFITDVSLRLPCNIVDTFFSHSIHIVQMYIFYEYSKCLYSCNLENDNIFFYGTLILRNTKLTTHGKSQWVSSNANFTFCPSWMLFWKITVSFLCLHISYRYPSPIKEVSFSFPCFLFLSSFLCTLLSFMLPIPDFLESI